MDVVDELDAEGAALGGRDVIGRIIVICAQVDDDEVGGLMRCETPERRVRAVYLAGAIGDIGGVKPLVGLRRSLA